MGAIKKSAPAALVILKLRAEAPPVESGQGSAPAQDANALYVAVRKLRRSLGEYGRWIVNIPKVGYVLSEEAEVGAGGPGRGRAVARYVETVSASLDENTAQAADERVRTMSLTQLVEFALGSAS